MTAKLLDTAAQSPINLMYAILCISGGIVMLGWGIRFFRTVIGLAGFAASSVFTFIFLANVDDRAGLGKHAKEIMIGGSIAVGCLGAMLSLWVWMVALGAVGALGGFSVAVWSLSWTERWLSGSVRRPVFIGGSALAGALLAVLYEKGVIVAATAAAGALAIVSGLDVFLQTGLNDQLRRVVTDRTFSFQPHSTGMLATAGCLFGLGAIFQYRVTGRERRAKW